MKLIMSLVAFVALGSAVCAAQVPVGVATDNIPHAGHQDITTPSAETLKDLLVNVSFGKTTSYGLTTVTILPGQQGTLQALCGPATAGPKFTVAVHQDGSISVDMGGGPCASPTHLLFYELRRP